MNPDHDPELLARRLEREQVARRHAEDIAEAKLRQLYLQAETIAATARVADIANDSSTFADAVERALPVVAELTGSEVGHALVLDADGSLRTSGIWFEQHPGRAALWQQATEATPFTVGLGLTGEVAATGVPRWIEDVGASGDFYRVTIEPSLAGRSAFALPVKVGQEVVAVLELFGARTQPADRDLIDVGAQIGTTLGRVVERERSIAQITEMNERLEARVAERTRQLDEARAVAEASSAAKTEALANVAHELRTPLTAILGLIDLASEAGVTRAAAADLASASAAARVLQGQVERLLALAALESSSLVLHTEPVVLADLLGRVVDDARPAAQGKGLALDLRIGPDAPATIATDPERLEQAIAALVDNAIKFTDHGRVAVAVSLTAGQRCRIEVHDTGSGMAPDGVSRLTESFVTGDPSPSRTHPGVGIGLAIASRLLALLGGRLGARSQPGSGTTFWVDLPIEAAQGPQDAPAADRPRRALLVEDNEVNRRITGAYLDRIGLDHDVAGDGAEAVDAVRTGRYGLVLMDLQMPVMDGYEATARIRALGAGLGEVPIVAVTASTVPGDRERCRAAGMDDYLSKPFGREDLAAKITPYLPPSADADADHGSMLSHE